MEITSLAVIPFVTLNTYLVTITYAYNVKFNDSFSKNELAKQEPCTNGQHYFDKGLCIDDNYMIERPPTSDLIPIYSIVNEMVILGINEKDKTIEIELVVMKYWRDQRLE